MQKHACLLFDSGIYTKDCCFMFWIYFQTSTCVFPRRFSSVEICVTLWWESGFGYAPPTFGRRSFSARFTSRHCVGSLHPSSLCTAPAGPQGPSSSASSSSGASISSTPSQRSSSPRTAMRTPPRSVRLFIYIELVHDLVWPLTSPADADVGEQHHSAADGLYLGLSVGLQRPGLRHLLHGDPRIPSHLPDEHHQPGLAADAVRSRTLAQRRQQASGRAGCHPDPRRATGR